MIYIEYCETGQAVNDFLIEQEFHYVQSYIQDGRDDTLYYSTENIFSRIRLGIVKGEITCDDVTFLFEDEYLHPNEYGALHNWPAKFCHLSGTLSEGILRGAFELHKSKYPEKYKGH